MDDIARDEFDIATVTDIEAKPSISGGKDG
jgi:hypothetical protein